MGGQSGTNNKSSGSTNPTGQPAWTSGSDNTSPSWASNGSIGAGATSAPQGGLSITPSVAGGAAPSPGTPEYNAMNEQLATAPMQSLLGLIQNGGQNPESMQVIQNLLGSSGSNAGMDQAAELFRQLGTTGTNNFQSVFDAAAGPGAMEKYLTDYANGNMMNSNPYLDEIVRKAESDAMSGVNQMFAAGGRYGSGMNQGTVSEAIANANNQFRGQEYENESQRRIAAAQGISGEQTNRFGVQNNAAQGVGNLQGAAASGLGQLGASAMQNWLSAQNNAGQLGTAGTTNMLNGMGALGAVQNNKMFDANQQLKVGDQTTQQTQQQINDLINQYTQGDMSDWARTGGLLSAGTGAAGNWGTQTGTQKQTMSPGLLNIIAGLGSAAGMA